MKRRIRALIPRFVLARLRKPVWWGSLRRAEPFSRGFGRERGMPICWHYIRKFLAAHSADIQGRVLEIGDDTYTRMFGGSSVTKSDVLHVEEGSPLATVVADLTSGEGLESNSFDCIIVTQTLGFIFDVQSAVRTIHRILKPGGVVLATVPGISQISRYDMDRWGDYWRFTSASMSRLFDDFTGDGTLEVRTWGNVAASVAYLEGLSVEDLGQKWVDHTDPDYQLLITARAVKGPGAAR